MSIEESVRLVHITKPTQQRIQRFQLIRVQYPIIYSSGKKDKEQAL